MPMSVRGMLANAARCSSVIAPAVSVLCDPVAVVERDQIGQRALAVDPRPAGAAALQPLRSRSSLFVCLRAAMHTPGTSCW